MLKIKKKFHRIKKKYNAIIRKLQKFYTYCSYPISMIMIIIYILYAIDTYKLKKTVKQDLEFIHKTILENHPGPYNNQDLNFAYYANDAYIAAKKAIDKISRQKDHPVIIQKYIASFYDTNLQLLSNNSIYNRNNDKSFSVKKIFYDGVWITLPTFAPNKRQKNELESILDQISQYRKSRLIIFDIRDNTGGNSQWGIKILENLFCKQYVSECLSNMNRNIEVDWRASKDNVAYLSNLTTHIIEQFGQDSQQVSYIKTIEQGVKNAYENNQPFYTQSKKTEATFLFQSCNPVTAQIIVITSSQNTNACLDFIDDLKAINPKTILIGQKTSANTVYAELRTINLPSNIGKLQFPIKMYRNRVRGNKVAYVPDIAYPENIASEKERNAWLQETIQTRLESL